MNLLVDCHCFDFGISQGITTYIQGLYQILPSLAIDIDFYFVAADVEKLRSIFGEGNNIHYVSLTSKNRIHRLIFEIPNIVKKYNIDVAHFQYISPIIKNCKTIVTLHDILFVDFPKYFPFNYRISKAFLFKLSAKRADLLCTVSNYSRKRISFHYGIEENKIIITPNAISHDFISIQGNKPHYFPDKYLLYVSRIEPRKNHIALVKAFERLNLAEKGYSLIFVGKETVETPELHKYIDNLNEKDKAAVRVISQVSFSELKLWYKYASLFIYSTLAEGFGIPPLEAGATGIPVICNNSTAMADFSFFGDNLIDISDDKILDNRIIEILFNDCKMNLREISNEIYNRYSWNTITNEFNMQLNIFR